MKNKRHMICEDLESWHIVECPANVQFSSVRKESGTHGKIYAIWDCECQTPCWISQSIPKVVEAINTRVFGTTDKRLHASSIYRVLRGESTKCLHKSHRVVRFHRTELEEFNALLTRFPRYFFVTKAPDFWRIQLPHPSTSPEGSAVSGDAPEADEGGVAALAEAPIAVPQAAAPAAPAAAPAAEPGAQQRRPRAEAHAEAEELPEDRATLSRFGEAPPHTDGHASASGSE